jgi:hypothetical protein
MKKGFPHWHLSLSIAVGLLLIMSAIFSRTPPTTPMFSSPDTGVSKAEIVEARKTMGETIVNEETHLFTILGLQMGIVAFAATMVFGKDFAMQKPRELFGILTLLTIILALLYLHVYKELLGAYTYAVQLESSLPGGLRTYQQIYQRLAEPEAPLLLRPIISLTNTFYLVSFLPVYVVAIASVGFGRKLSVRTSTIWAINVLVVAWAVAYLLPIFRTIAEVGG